MDIETIKRNIKKEISIARLPVELAYLYGSFAKGRGKEGSDIDIAVLLTENEYLKNPLDMLGLVQNLAERLERKVRREVDIRILNRASLSFSYVVLTTGLPIYISSKIIFYRYQNKILGMFFDFSPFFEKYLTVYARI